MEAEALRRYYAELSDEALDDIVNVHPKDYTPEALELARAELLARQAQMDVEALAPAVPDDRTPQRSQIKGAWWFTFIAVLSLINTVLVILGSPMIFFFGLAVTQLIDCHFAIESAGFHPVPDVLNIGIVVIVLVLGYLARTSIPVYLTGMALYAVDAILALLLGSWKGFLVHVIVLVIMYVRLSPALAPAETGTIEDAGTASREV